MTTVMNRLKGPAEGVTVVLRKDLENQAYYDLKYCEEDDKFSRQSKLYELLVSHARAVMFSILRRNDPALAEDAANRVLQNLESFREEGQFTTWAHKIIMSVMYDQRRTERCRKEISMSEIVGFDVPGDPTIQMTELLLTIHKLLAPEDYTIFKQLVLLGDSHAEAAEALGSSRSTLSRNWDRITRILRNAFTERLPHRR